MKKVLDIGCGTRKRPGAIGVDFNPRSDADVFHNLNSFPYPFPDSQFDEVYADNVIEHLENVIAVMEEIHRITKPGGLVKIMVPYYRSRWAFIDPTHKHFFTAESMSYFSVGHILHERYKYSTATFQVTAVVFNENFNSGILKSLLKWIANIWPVRYERYLSHLLPLDELSFVLDVEKP